MERKEEPMKRQSVVKECPEKWSEKEDETENTKMKGKNDVRRDKGRGRREEINKERGGGGGGREETRQKWTRRDKWIGRDGKGRGRERGKGRGEKKRRGCNNIPLSFDCRGKRTGKTNFVLTNGCHATTSGSFQLKQLVSMCLSFPLCPP